MLPKENWEFAVFSVPLTIQSWPASRKMLGSFYLLLCTKHDRLYTDLTLHMSSDS